MPRGERFPTGKRLDHISSKVDRNKREFARNECVRTGYVRGKMNFPRRDPLIDSGRTRCSFDDATTVEGGAS